MADIKEVLETAGVKAVKAEPLDWDGEKDCFVVTIDQSAAMESWRKFAAASEQTRYHPVFPADGDIQAFEATTEKALDQIREFQKTHPLPTMPGSETAQQRMQDAARAFKQAAPMMEEMMKMFGMTHDRVDEVFKPPTGDPRLAELHRQANREMVDVIAAQPMEIANILASGPALFEQMGAIKRFEQSVLTDHCKEGERPSLEALIACGESLDIDKWIELKRDPSRKLGDFSKQQYQYEEPPTSNKLLLLPVEKSWHIPAVLRVGCGEAMGDHPPSHIHVAMLKRWHERYGAELVTIGPYVMYLTVSKPVITKDDALKLAIEQFAYCPEILLSSAGDCTLSGGAIDVLNSKFWHFWWN